MKFIKYVKKHKFLWCSFILLSLAGLTSFRVQAYQDTPVIDPKPLSRIYPIRDETAPVLVSLAALYSPWKRKKAGPTWSAQA